MVETKRKKNYRIKSKIFYSLLMIIPISQFCVFYIGINFNSILMAFKAVRMVEIAPDVFEKQTYAFIQDGHFNWWILKENFGQWFKNSPGRFEYYYWGRLGPALKSSLLVYLLSLVTGVPLGMLFSYYIFKKCPGSGLFRVFLFLPSIICSMVMVLMYSYFVDTALPDFLSKYFDKSIMGPIKDSSDPTAQFWTVAFYNIYVGFGVSVLMYSNKMAGISPEIIEAGKIDGATALGEFWHIVLPLAFPTLSIFLITGIATLFTNQFNVYSFYNGDGSAPMNLKTLGFFLFDRAKNEGTGRQNLPSLAALGLMLTAVAIPLTFGMRKALDTLGPSEE